MAWPMATPCASARRRRRRMAIMLRRPELVALLAMGLSACSLAPTYKVPEVPAADQYANATTPWTEAKPADHLNRDAWWKLYGDPRLDDLQGKLLANNATLAAAFAHYRQSEAFTRQVRAGLFPTIGLNGNGQRDRESDTRPLRGATSPAIYNSYTIGAQLDYEVDLWGRVADTVAAGTAEQA